MIRGFSPAVRDEIRYRSMGRCEAGIVGVCIRRASEIHHRKLRRHGDHRTVNGIEVCLPCHGWIHAHPARSYAAGLLVSGHDDPAQIEWRCGIVADG